MWPSTVRTDIVNSFAMALLVSPWATKVAISRSRRVSGSGEPAVCKPG